MTGAYTYETRLYFSVPNQDLRIKLITTQRKIEDAKRQLAENDIERHRLMVEGGKERFNWFSNVVSGLFCIAIGDLMFGVPGAICGAFIPQQGIQRHRAIVDKEVAALRKTFRREKKEADRKLSLPIYFCKEEESGLRDTTFGGAYHHIGWEVGSES